MKAEGKGQEIIPLLFEKGAVIDSDETCKVCLFVFKFIHFLGETIIFFSQAVRNYAPDSDLLFYIADACTFELLEVHFIFLFFFFFSLLLSPFPSLSHSNNYSLPLTPKRWP